MANMIPGAQQHQEYLWLIICFYYLVHLPILLGSCQHWICEIGPWCELHGCWLQMQCLSGPSQLRPWRWGKTVSAAARLLFPWSPPAENTLPSMPVVRHGCWGLTTRHAPIDRMLRGVANLIARPRASEKQQ